MGVGALILLGFAILAGVQLALLVWRGRQVAARAQDEWSIRSTRGDANLKGVSQDEFVAAYRHVHGPRGQVYVLGALTAAALATPIILAALYGAWHWGWVLSDKPRLYAPGNLLSQFFLFFGLIGAWVLIASRFAARYHRTRVLDLDHALLRKRAGLQ